MHLPTGATCDTLAARVEVVSWPAAVVTLHRNDEHPKDVCCTARDTTLADTYEHFWVLVRTG